MERFYTLLTNAGISALIAARANNTEIRLTKIAVGDGEIVPSQSMTSLQSEKYRFNINSLIQDENNSSYLIVEGVIPSDTGGFYVSEVGLYTDNNILFAIGSLPKTYKPEITEGSVKDLTIKIQIEVANADVVNLKVDDTVVLATRKFVQSELLKYALVNGDENKKFKVAPATQNNEAITFGQFKDEINNVSSNLCIKPLSRHNKPLFTKVNPHSISIPAGFKVAVNNKIISLSEDYVLSLNSNLDEGTKIAGKDYYVYARENGTFYISANNSIATDKLVGGFHYGLTPENEVRPTNALKTEDDMVMSRGIKGYSLWDLSWKPKNKRPEGKVLVNNIFWRDIYPADEDYALRGYSSCFALDGATSAKIAGGAETNGRKFPKIPLTKGGNGTLNYGSLTWYEANEIINEVGSRMISYDEFSNSSYGVVEQKSLKELGYPLGTGIIKHYRELESKWGVEMAVGCQWTWTKELMNGYGTTDFAHRLGLTDNRGYLYATSNSPVAGLCGGQEEHDSTTPVGSRAFLLNYYVWHSYWSNGFVAVCDHVNLDK